MKQTTRFLAAALAALLAAVLLAGCGDGGGDAESGTIAAEVASREAVPEKILISDAPDGTPFPSEDNVKAARTIALAGMTEADIDDLTDLIYGANLKLEDLYLSHDLFGHLEDPDDLYWNYFTKTGEIQIGWATDKSPEEIVAICKKEKIRPADFYQKYGEKVVAENPYNIDDFVKMLEELKGRVHSAQLQDDLQQIADEAFLGARDHAMPHINEMFKRLHDMDYFLLRYGPNIRQGQVTFDHTFVSRYYNTLSFYKAADEDGSWQ